MPVALGSAASLGGSVGFLPSSALAGAAVPVALGSAASLGGSVGFLPSSALAGAAVLVALGSITACVWPLLLSSPGLSGGDASGTGARNAPISGFSFFPAIVFFLLFFKICRNASQLETHFQPMLSAEIVLDLCLIVVVDCCGGIVECGQQVGPNVADLCGVLPQAVKNILQMPGVQLIKPAFHLSDR